MVTITLSEYEARKLKVLLKADLKDFRDGLLALKEIEIKNPKVRLGSSGIMPSQAIDETSSACSVLETIVEQLSAK